MDTKTEYMEALISTKDLADKLEVPCASVFPCFSTPSVGIRSSVLPALQAADKHSFPLDEISNLDKEPLEQKPANPVNANLPVVTEEFTAISTKIEVSIEDEDNSSSTNYPARSTFVGSQNSSFPA
eukprot:scaffold185462_cov54-Attheya_sp.AAC.1